MNYLISVKTSLNTQPMNQQVVSEVEALNIVRGAMIRIQPMEETSADLKAMNFLRNVTLDKPMALENKRTGKVMVLQVHEEDENV